MYQESTKPLMRPRQVEEAKDELRRLDGMMTAAPHIASQIQDIGEIRRQHQNLKRSLDGQAPRVYAEAEIDAACNREAELREAWLEGMPTQKEMRRNASGCKDKHRRWEKRTKEKILEWKNIRLRQHASGLLDELPDASDIASIERFRPDGGSQELNMHNEQIQGRVQYGPAPGAGPAVVFSDAESEAVKALDPELHARMPLMSNETRGLLKTWLKTMAPDGNVQVKMGKLPTEGVATSSYDLTSGEFIPDQPIGPAPDYNKPKKRQAKRKRQSRIKTPEERKAWGAMMKAAREKAAAARKEG